MTTRTCLHCGERVESGRRCPCVERRRQRLSKRRRGYPRGWDRLSKRLRAVQRFCAYCGESNPTRLGIDHVIPLALGGSNDLSNLTTCCHRCNARKKDRLPTRDEMVAAGTPAQLQLEGVEGGVPPRKSTRTDPASQARGRSLILADWPAVAAG